ncbi:MAG: imidazoleglycerol-phosphate dehydratase, partial [Pseudomonadota bacterium]
MRKARIKRKTGETHISLALNIDGRGEFDVATGIGFLDHMLESFSRHGLFDMQAAAVGDTQVDQHHLVEDCGIVLG